MLKGLEFYVSFVSLQRFSKKQPILGDRLAQLVEHLTFNQRVPGSSPGQVTKIAQRKLGFFCAPGWGEKFIDRSETQVEAPARLQP